MTASKRRTTRTKPTKPARPPKPDAVEPAPAPECPLLNRELSHLEFQRRVLEEARDESNPILERARFLSIFFSNLDEFFMVRVAGLIKQVQARVRDRSADDLTPAEQLAAVRKKARALMAEGQTCFRDVLRPELAKQGVHVLDYADLTAAQREKAHTWFQEVAFPILTPLAYDPGHPFPHISNLSLNLAVTVTDGTRPRFARIKVPESLPRLVPLKRSSGGTRRDGTVPRAHYLVWIEQLIAAHIDELFPGMKVVDVRPFHVTRDADTEIQELEADDLLDMVEETIRKRRFGTLVRMMVNPDLPESVREVLVENLEMDARDVYALEGPLALSDLKSLTEIDAVDLKFPAHHPWVPTSLRRPGDGRIFDAIRRHDLLFHHPYDSFVPVVDFLEQAARDPNVLAIKQTLYRVGRNSPIVEALLTAREEGKQVSVLVELKARFDEESNIEWARKLEQEGVHVIYGVVGLKTHSKIALVVRKDPDRIRRYVHLGTGNYNPSTAKTYEDIGILTCDEAIGADATDLFNYLTGFSAKSDYRRLLVAPVNLRARLEALVRRETEHARKGRHAHLILKMNSLVDPALILLLYEAARAGVQVDLITRGICCLQPGVSGTDGRIRVVSILGRFLEHSRIYYFQNRGHEEVYLGSADLMPRNLDHRIEVVFPVESPEHVRYLRDRVLGTALADNTRAREMQPDGSYRRVMPPAGEPVVDVQLALIGTRPDTVGEAAEARGGQS